MNALTRPSVASQCENLQKIGAFKYRGALNAVKKYQEEHADEHDTVFVAHSGGNHAQVRSLALTSYRLIQLPCRSLAHCCADHAAALGGGTRGQEQRCKGCDCDGMD